jgi:2-polyprenyl-6-methoxyphenol hydroxylase-like FAD-dependent oxidoreductase
MLRAQPFDVPVLIAGAGPVGLSLACELERLGVELLIADAAPARAAVSRATDLHARSLELWDQTGLAGAVLRAALPITGVPLISGGRQVARLDFEGVDSAFPAAVSLRQRELEALLEEHLRHTAVEPDTTITVLRQDEDGVVANVGGEEIRAGFVVACDGVHSALRRALGIPFDGGEYPGRWAVMDAAVDGWPYGPGEIPVFLDQDGFWAMPLPGGRLRLFFRDDGAGEQPAVADAQRVIDRHVPGAPEIVDAQNRACFALHHRVARRFRVGRVLLAGDAAHAMTPVSGQGMNTGIQDAYNLAWKLRLALDGAPPALLNSYDAERREVALATVAASGAVHEANVLEGDAAAARDRGLAAALATPAQVLAAVEAGHELGIAYPAGAVVAGRVPAGALGVLPGGRVPDAGPLLRADGSVTSLRELLHAPALQLWLCAGVGGHERAMELATRFAPALPVVVFAVAGVPPGAAAGVEVVADPTLRAHGRLGAVSAAAYVVRPDGHLAFRCEPPDAGWLAARLRSIGVRAATAARRSGQPTKEDTVKPVDIVKDITNKMCDHDFDLDLVDSAYADDFVHHGNGAPTDKAGYFARGREYRERYERIDRPEFDELFTDGDRVVASYTLTLHRRDRSTERMAVMAIWTLADGKVTALREVDAPAA